MKSDTLDLRRRLEANTPLVVPGCYDTLSALIAAKSGFEAVLVSGFGVSASLLGMPDVELYTESDMVDVVRRVCARVTVPVFADADNGYGNAINVMKTVKDFESAGAAAVTIEDQQSPKQCPLLNNRPLLIPIDEAIGKIRAAVAARHTRGMLIIARTDAVDSQEVVERAMAYSAAGADAIKLISPAIKSLDILRTVRQKTGKPLMVANLGWLNSINTTNLNGIVDIITHPLLALKSAATAVRDNLQALKGGADPGAATQFPTNPMSQKSLEQLLDLDRIRALEASYLVPSGLSSNT